MDALTPRSSDPLIPGLRIGPYLLLTPLGSGGSSRVWAVARTGQLGFSKRMALKVMRQDRLTSERARQRFDREARLGAQLRHTNLRAVHELGSHEGRPHMALAWVDTSLEELLQHAPGRRLEPEVVCWFGIQACAALGAAHAHVNPTGQPSPVVHGDVSPGNILLSMNGHVLLADLAASPEASPSGAAPQRSSKFFGSLGYAAPEALRGESVDGRADLFALGCVLYEALCGCFAFEADDEHSLLFQVLERGPLPLSQREPSVPEQLARVVHRALERSVEQRFAGAEEMQHALYDCIPTLTPFALERLSTDLIGKVLGERVRQREEQMRLTYQRFAASQLERTDTLPIGNATRQRESATLRHSLPDAAASARGAPVSDPGGVVAAAQPKQKRRTFWLALAAVAVASAGYVAWPRRGQPVSVLTAAATPERSPGARSPGAADVPPEAPAVPDQRQASRRTEAADAAPAAPPAGGAATPAAPSGAEKPRPPKAPNPAGTKRAPAAGSGATLRPPAAPAAPPERRKFHPPGDPYQDVDQAPPSRLKSAPTR